jgi:hypothetical protein
MNRSEVALLLGAIAVRDHRTIGAEDVHAWYADIGDLGLDECRTAVSRHFRESTEWLMPAHVVRLVRMARAGERGGHEVRALPSRFEHDPNRVVRAARGVALCRLALAQARARRDTGNGPSVVAASRSGHIPLRDRVTASSAPLAFLRGRTEVLRENRGEA